MQYQETSKQLTRYRKEIGELRKKMRELQEAVEPQEAKDYEFSTPDGTVRLSELFGGKEYLFVVHNMGASCTYCTLWADGFSGVQPHLENRAAFVVSSPDAPEAQQKFKSSRNWRFRMVSHLNSSFAADMGYKTDKGWMPGVSVFRKRGGKIYRVSDTSFGPGDDFCNIWHLFDLIPEGAAGWQPKYTYQ